MVEYFAYGSNMNPGHLRAYMNRFGVGPEGVSDPQRAILHNFRLRTNYHSTTHSAGAFNIEPAQGEVVEGVVMTITPAALEVIKIKEGWPGRYVDLEIDVQVGSEKEGISAITFVVHADHRLEHDHPVTRKYRDLVVAGAEDAGLSPMCREHLRRILKVSPETLISSPGDTAGHTYLTGPLTRQST